MLIETGTQDIFPQAVEIKDYNVIMVQCHNNTITLGVFLINLSEEHLRIFERLLLVEEMVTYQFVY